MKQIEEIQNQAIFIDKRHTHSRINKSRNSNYVHAPLQAFVPPHKQSDLKLIVYEMDQDKRLVMTNAHQRGERLLKYSSDDCPINSRLREQNHVYKIGGDSKLRRTANANLIKKIRESRQVQQPIEVQPAEQQVQKADQQAENLNQLIRYFNADQERPNALTLKDVKLCHRCRNPGHYVRNCPQQRTILCIYCLSKHQSTVCLSLKICYKCGKEGHISRDCQMRGGECNACKHLGHSASSCKFLAPLRDQSQMRNAECLFCRKRGHLRCKSRKQESLFHQLSQISDQQSPYRRRR